jgi:hypothetical protein
LTIEYFHTTGDAAGEPADVGRGKLASSAAQYADPPLLRLACRDGAPRLSGEREMLARISDAITSAGYGFSPTLVVTFYVSLKTNPFVVLTGAEGRGKTEFVQLFAEALVGRDSPQYALIAGSAALPPTVGAASYYRSLQERFSSLRFLELLQEAASPSNAGRLYLVCFDALHPSELDYYFASLLQVTPGGKKQLNLPGFSHDRLPVVPPNVYITATVNVAEQSYTMSRAALRHAGLIEFRAPTGPRPIAEPRLWAPPPPVGYQRLWLRTVAHDVAAARARLAEILGAREFSQLRPSFELQQLLWHTGEVLLRQTLDDLTIYVANSFDEHGCGLFDPLDRQRNAQMAFDAQVVQRVLWRLRLSEDLELRRDLTVHLNRLEPTAEQQAVA